MTDPIETNCEDPAGHWLHICQLKKLGRQKEMAALMEEPAFTCLNCNAVAKYAKNLCNPNRIKES